MGCSGTKEAGVDTGWSSSEPTRRRPRPRRRRQRRRRRRRWGRPRRSRRWWRSKRLLLCLCALASTRGRAHTGRLPIGRRAGVRGRCSRVEYFIFALLAPSARAGLIKYSGLDDSAKQAVRAAWGDRDEYSLGL